MNQISDLDLSYIAGVIDCDGSIIAQFVYHKDYRPERPYEIRLTIQISQLKKRRWWLDKFVDIIGEGTVRDRPLPKDPKKHISAMSDYVLVGVRPVGELLKQLRPFFKSKNKQADLIIRITEQLAHSNDPAIYDQILDLVDQASNNNDSKKRTITAEVVRDRMRQGLNESSL